MKRQKSLTRREMLKLSGTVAGGSMLAAYAPAVPQAVKETVVVPQTGPVTLELFDPTGAYEVTQTFTPRIDTLAGKTICEVTNGSWEAARTDPYIIEQLKKLYPTATFIPSSALPKLSTTIEVAGLEDAVKAAKCDAVIVGNAG